MTQLQRAIQRELDDFIEKIRDPQASLARVSKAAFTKARAKLKHTAFIELSKLIIDEFYQCAPFKKSWKGFRLVAADGTNMELPNSADLVRHFGLFGTRSDGKKIAMAQGCCLFDPLNHLTLAADIQAFSTSESAIVWDLLEQSKDFKQGDLFIFDRYFASSILALYLNERGIDFCFRLKDTWSEARSMKNGQATDIVIELKIPQAYKQKATELKLKARSMQVRLVKVELENGEVEILMTSLMDQEKYNLQDLKELYFLRWGIEENYKVFKHKVCIENFSGKTVHAVKQDFFAKIFIMNLTATMVQPIDDLLKEKPRKKHIHKVNFTEALSKMKYAPIYLFINKIVNTTISTLHQWFLKTTEPIRKGRKYKRTKLPKRKYPQNYKPV